MTYLNHNIHQIESAIHKLAPDATTLNKAQPAALEDARRIVRASLQRMADIAIDSSLSFSDTYEAIASNCSSHGKRAVALVTIRLVSCDGLFSSGHHFKSWSTHSSHPRRGSR